jgi:hypothetical protein
LIWILRCCEELIAGGTVAGSLIQSARTRDDGDLVTQLFDVRVLAEDNGNTPLTGIPDFVPIGGVDQGNVQLFILSNTSRPLVVDTSDPPDGLCDDINPELVPTTKPQTDTDAQVVNMLPISPHRGADFSPNPTPPV